MAYCAYSHAPENSICSSLITLVSDHRDAATRHSDRTGKYALHKANCYRFLECRRGPKYAARHGAPEQRDEQHDALPMLGSYSSLWTHVRIGL